MTDDADKEFLAAAGEQLDGPYTLEWGPVDARIKVTVDDWAHAMAGWDALEPLDRYGATITGRMRAGWSEVREIGVELRAVRDAAARVLNAGKGMKP